MSAGARSIAVCTHQRVRDHTPPYVDRSDAPPDHVRRWVVQQTGWCIDCGRPVERVTEIIHFGLWQVRHGKRGE